MAAAKGKETDPIEEFKENHRITKHILERTKYSARRAYDVAAGKHLMGEHGLDTDRLADQGTRAKFGKDLADTLADEVNQYLGTKVSDKDKFRRDAAMSAYYDITYSQIEQMLERYGKDFTFDLFYAQLTDERDGSLRRVAERLAQTSTAHIKEHHLPKVLASVKGLSDWVNKDRITREQAIGLLLEQENYGAVRPNTHQHEVYAN